jgi:hypothetical protein
MPLSLNGGQPEPQGIRTAGVDYKNGHLDASQGAELYTGGAVYPAGLGTDLGVTTLPDGSTQSRWVYTTATNRMEYKIEVLASYTGDQPGRFQVYDESCSLAPTYPTP